MFPGTDPAPPCHPGTTLVPPWTYATVSANPCPDTAIWLRKASAQPVNPLATPALLLYHPGPTLRFRLILVPIRQFGFEKLQSSSVIVLFRLCSQQRNSL